VPVNTFSIQQQVRHETMYIDSHPPVPLELLKIPGRHNVENVLAALTVIDAAKFDWDAAVSALGVFEGVEHRIEFVAEMDGVKMYNDSKSTNVDSLRVALESFPQQPVVLIAGGRGKGGGYTALKGLVKKTLKFLVTIGEEAGQLEQDLGDVVEFQRAENMQNAVAIALEHSTDGDIVLLSPACASFDWYKNYEERGRDFKESVLRLVQAQESGAKSIGEPA
jgi:UDP-N-acetylmuramoylalanine--D-glutamate ligase